MVPLAEGVGQLIELLRTGHHESHCGDESGRNYLHIQLGCLHNNRLEDDNRTMGLVREHRETQPSIHGHVYVNQEQRKG